MESTAQMDIAVILQQRDRQSFAWLYNRYAAMVFGLIRKMAGENAEAENLLLETFVTVWRTLDDFEGKEDDLMIRMLRIARAKVAECAKHGSHYGQDGLQLRGLGTSALNRQAMGQKQYSNS